MSNRREVVIIPTEEHLKKEKQALLGLKLMEAIWSIMCIGLHSVGFQNSTEPFPYPYEQLFCGVFVGSSLISTIFFLSVCCGYIKINYVAETVVSLMSFVAFAACGFIAMYHVENDVHLKYMTGKEEKSHKFFIRGRMESILSMQTSGIFLVHGVLMLDALGWLNTVFGGCRSRLIVYGRDKHAYYGRLCLNPFWILPWEKMVHLFRKCCQRTPE
ncbi:uncharacterized protein LOC135705150 [Ochlerotatus camptorhynchus]|uniref:uncharacterized protein LOC135705150 n=1 Tax=Ochlerotatus camptorhynchus TaxID=644619 RepID=UPI0031DDBC44